MEIKQIIFGPKHYLVVRKKIPTSSITDSTMYDAAGRKLGEYMSKKGINPSGPWSVLYYMWDDVGAVAEIGISMPVDGPISVDDPELSSSEIPRCEAFLGVVKGSYDGLGRAHEELMRYSREHGKGAAPPEVLAVEEYVIDPMKSANPSEFVTNIYYLSSQ